MKINRILGFVLAIGSLQNAFSQMVVPHPIPCLSINPTSIDTLGSGVSAADCIEVDGETVNFKTDQHYSVRAGEFIQFDPNTVITSDGSHQFHAYIQREDMDMAWYYPNATPGTVGQYEKLEIGVKFKDTINDKIENFVKNQAGAKLNPFNPEDVDLYAEFWVKVGASWFGPKRVNGFYYEEFARNADTIHWDTLATDHNFRIRFALPTTGLYRCKVSANVYGHGVQTVSEFTFDCVPSDNKGFVHVGENARYLNVGNEPFFPVGQNLTGPNKTTLTSEWAAHPVEAYIYDIFKGQMTELAANGANYFRYIASPWQTEIEFEHLGNYSNRMTNAWEFDKILDTAKALDLKMHFNMAMHYTFERPSRYAMTFWDWTAKGDTLSPHPMYPADEACWHDNDSGYCYRRELDIANPIDFFSDSTAMTFYKKRLRYMVARWGYSTEIGVMELLSEANNVGSEHIINYRLVGGYGGCYNLSSDDDSLGLNSVLHYPYTDTVIAPTFLPQLAAWQIEMCRYIKEDLGHYEHPLAVDYTGTPYGDVPVPDYVNGDHTYFSAYVDICNFNYYALAVNQAETNYSYVQDHRYALESVLVYKPFMNPEYGTGKVVWRTDHNTGYIKRVCLTPFTGTAGSGMTWDSHFNEYHPWQYLGPVKDYMEGVPLDEGNWQEQPPIVQEDLSVELLYLRQGEWGENTRIMGAIANRTFNYYTQGDTLYDADSVIVGSRAEENVPDIDYQIATNYTNSDMDDNFKFTDMGVLKGYQIEWTNAITGELLGLTSQISNLSGNLKLNFPVTLTGNLLSLTGDTLCPILFFKLYRSDATFLAPVASNEFESALPDEYKKDDELNEIPITAWGALKDSINIGNFLVTVSPNPTSGPVNISISGANEAPLNWVLTDNNGKVLMNNNVITNNFTLDLSVYSNDTYYLVLKDDSGMIKQTVKIVKL